MLCLCHESGKRSKLCQNVQDHSARKYFFNKPFTCNMTKSDSTAVLVWIPTQGCTVPGFPQTFDNWIQGLFKDFQGEQQQFSRTYFKARPPLPPLLANGSSHEILFCHMTLTENSMMQMQKLGQKQIQGLFKDFIQFWPNSRTFKALKLKQFFQGFSSMWEPWFIYLFGVLRRFQHCTGHNG